MILEITVDANVKTSFFDELGITDQVIYAEVAGVNVSERRKNYTLRSCPIVCDEYDNPPVWAKLSAWDGIFYLCLEYKKLDEAELVSVGFPVTAKTVQGFPKI